jgi:hypothetical protein
MRVPLILLVAVACASNTPATSTRIAPCTGRQMLVVTNSLSEPVDVFVTTREAMKSTLVGEVRAKAREEFVVSADASGAYAKAVGGDSPVATSRRESDVNAVRFDYRCDSRS